MSTIAFTVGSVHPSAAPYYRQFPLEPIPGGSNAFVTVTKVVELADNRVETLLKAIAAHVDAKESKASIVVVSHGNETGISFTMGRVRGAGVPLNAPAIKVLRANLAGQLDDTEAAKRLQFGTVNAARDPTGVEWLKELKAAMAKVHKLGLGRLDLRACITGRNKDTLRQLQFFFNADLCCAPDAWDTFGPVPFADITTNPSTWNKFRRDHPGALVVGVGKERFALYYKVLGNQLKVMLAAIATSQAAIDMWVKNHLPPSTQYSGGALHYHGLTPDQKTIIWAGEPAFRGHLVEVTDGKGATVKLDTGALQPAQLP